MLRDHILSQSRDQAARVSVSVKCQTFDVQGSPAPELSMRGSLAFARHVDMSARSGWHCVV